MVLVVLAIVTVTLEIVILSMENVSVPLAKVVLSVINPVREEPMDLVV